MWPHDHPLLLTRHNSDAHWAGGVCSTPHFSMWPHDHPLLLSFSYLPHLLTCHNSHAHIWSCAQTHGSGVQRDRTPWSCEDRKGYSPEDQCFLSISPKKNSNSLCHNCPTHLSCKCLTHLSHKCLTHLSHKCPTHLSHKCPTHLSHKCPIPISHPIYLHTSICVKSSS